MLQREPQALLGGGDICNLLLHNGRGLHLGILIHLYVLAFGMNPLLSVRHNNVDTLEAIPFP